MLVEAVHVQMEEAEVVSLNHDAKLAIELWPLTFCDAPPASLLVVSGLVVISRHVSLKYVLRSLGVGGKEKLCREARYVVRRYSGNFRRRRYEEQR